MLPRFLLILAVVTISGVSCSNRKYGHRTAFHWNKRVQVELNSTPNSSIASGARLNSASGKETIATPVNQNNVGAKADFSEVVQTFQADFRQNKLPGIISYEQVNSRKTTANVLSADFKEQSISPKLPKQPSSVGQALLMLGAPTLICLILGLVTNINSLALILIWALLVLVAVSIFVSFEFEA